MDNLWTSTRNPQDDLQMKIKCHMILKPVDILWITKIIMWTGKIHLWTPVENSLIVVTF